MRTKNGFFVYRELKDDEIMFITSKDIDIDTIKTLISGVNIDENIIAEINLLEKNVVINIKNKRINFSSIISDFIWDSEHYCEHPFWKWETTVNICKTIDKYFKSLDEDFGGRTLGHVIQ